VYWAKSIATWSEVHGLRHSAELARLVAEQQQGAAS